jgi:hypothetical protein
MVTPEHHDALVDRLVQATTPVRRMWSVRARFAVFATLGMAALGMASLAAPRPDLVLRLRDPSFMLGLALLIAATCATAFLALRSSVPDRFPSRTESAMVALLVAVAAAVTALPSASDGPVTPMTEWLCALRTLVVAAVPWTLLLVAIRRGAPVRVTTAATYAGAAALLLSTAILRTGCPQDGPTHWLAWHFAAVLVGVVLSAALAPAWLRAWRRH